MLRKTLDLTEILFTDVTIEVNHLIAYLVYNMKGEMFNPMQGLGTILNHSAYPPKALHSRAESVMDQNCSHIYSGLAQGRQHYSCS